MISLRLRVAASLKNRLVRTFRQASSTVDTFVGNQQCHNSRLLLLNQNKMNTEHPKAQFGQAPLSHYYRICESSMIQTGWDLFQDPAGREMVN